MHADWYLVQVTADLRKHEPRNVGVVLQAGGSWHFHFRGVEANGSLNGHLLRGLGVSKDTYKSWVDYFVRKARAGQWDEAMTLPERLPSNFTIVPGGTILDVVGDPRFAMNRLFSELVSMPEKAPHAPVDLARKLLAETQVEAKEHIRILGKWDSDGPEIEVPFDFGLGFENRITMEALSPNPTSVSYLRLRLDAIHRTGHTPNVIAMMPFARADQDIIGNLLRPIEKHVSVLDLDSSKASEDLRQMIS